MVACFNLFLCLSAADTMAEMDRFDDDYFDPSGHQQKGGVKFDANLQLAYAIERIGPLVLAIKKKFDEYCDDGSASLTQQKAIGKLLNC